MNEERKKTVERLAWKIEKEVESDVISDLISLLKRMQPETQDRFGNLLWSHYYNELVAVARNEIEFTEEYPYEEFLSEFFWHIKMDMKNYVETQ